MSEGVNPQSEYGRLQGEIARLRAEVERLKYLEGYLANKVQEFRCERDEALAQVAMLSKSVLQLSLSLKRAEAVVEAVKKHTWIGEGSREIEEALAAYEVSK